MKIHLHGGDIHLLDIRTRMPFKYGIATMTSTPHAFVRLHVEVDGKRAMGSAADHLPPKWFTKDPARAIDDEIAEMLRVIEHALMLASGLRADSPFAAWQALFAAQGSWGRDERLPPLLTHFGTSLVERALIDAFCRAVNQPFAHVLHTNQFGIRLGEIHSVMMAATPSHFLPTGPGTQVLARHTVGLADPLTDEEIPVNERIDDGLPQSLVACIRNYRLRHFKIKVSGTPDRDLDRLRRVASAVTNHASEDFAFSLDGNEQFHSVTEFRGFWEALSSDPTLQAFFGHLLFVEQPLHRAVTLDPAAGDLARDWPDRPLLIIDESDGDLDSLPCALRLGYAGTSHKNCKGVFKGIANACLLEQLRRTEPGRQLLLSGEDLANIGPVALLQDLAVAAALGIISVERNGHHYFAGLSMFPPEVQRQMLESHGDLYHKSRDGWPTLLIHNGTLHFHSVLDAPFGIQPIVNVEQFTPLAAWRRVHN